MPGFDITSFMGKFDGGARSYLFYWVPAFPAGVGSTLSVTEDIPYLVRAASLPEDTVDELIVNWQGADFKMAGRRTFTDWTITVNCDRKAQIRQDLHKWVEAIHNLPSNIYGEPKETGSLTTGYFVDQNLQMLEYDGSLTKTLHLVGSWLKSIGPITLDYSAQDVAYFDVTFTYQYHLLS